MNNRIVTFFNCPSPRSTLRLLAVLRTLNPLTATGRIYTCTSQKRPSRWPRTYIYVQSQFRFYAFVKARPPWLLLHVSEVSSSSVRWSLLALLGLFHRENSSSMLRAVFVQMAGNSVVDVPRCDTSWYKLYV